MELRGENFLGLIRPEKFKGLKGLECWNGFVMGSPHTRLYPYRRGHSVVTLLTESLRNTLVLKGPIYRSIGHIPGHKNMKRFSYPLKARVLQIILSYNFSLAFGSDQHVIL